MSAEYTMFGDDDRWNPVVATNVTAEEARAFAEAKSLRGFFLAPQYGEDDNSGGIRSYERHDDGGYGVVTLRRWTAQNHLDL